MSALDDLINILKSHEHPSIHAIILDTGFLESDDDLAMQKVNEAAAELAQLRARNAELEEYHGFHMGTIPPGEPTVEETRLRTQLADARHVIDLAELTDGNMPSDARARLAVAEFRRKYPEVK